MAGTVSTKGRYALRVMVDIGQHDGWVSLGDIARRQDISRKYLEQVMALLSKAGFVESQRGKGGGYRLTRDPADYTVGAILRVAENGPLAPVACLDCSQGVLCERAAYCPTLPLWQELGQVMASFLDSKTLADIMDGAPELPEEVAEGRC